jgi:hypothetical protein
MPHAPCLFDLSAVESGLCPPNEGNDLMDRRMFLRKFLDLGKKAAFLHLLAGCTNFKTSAGQTAEEHPPSPFKDYSLRELAQEKLQS